MDATLLPFSAGLPDPLVLATADAPAPDLRAEAIRRLGAYGCALLAPEALAAAVDAPLTALQALAPAWQDLPPDTHLKDGGRYRYRRHGSLVQSGPAEADLRTVPHRAHWQPTTYNALHGGMLRWFEPLTPALAEAPAFRRLVAGLGALLGEASAQRHPGQADCPGPDQPWFIEVHPFRIDTTDGVGRPTPEGAHRDGVDYVVVILVDRCDVVGGETRVFQADSPLGLRLTLQTPWTAMLLDDPRVIHETTPIQPASDERRGHRDTLVITFRRGGFQDP